MKACSLLIPFYLAPALAAPVFYTSTTVLVASSSASSSFRQAVFRPSHLAADDEPQRPVMFGGGFGPQQPHTVEDIPSSFSSSTPSLDSERPLSTQDLMALTSKTTTTTTSHESSSPESLGAAPPPSPPPPPPTASFVRPSTPQGGGKSRVITVGTLVVLESDHPFLVPGYYIPNRPRGDVLIVGGIVALLLVALAVESLEMSLLTRRRRIQNSEERMLVDDEEANSEDDMVTAPFGGGNYRYHLVEEKALQLPEKWDEKKGPAI